MFSNEKVNNEATIQALKEEMDDFTESGYLLTEEYMERLARSIFTASKLPDGDEYVGIIGNGYERSNLEAINTLLWKNMDTLCEIQGIYHFERGIEILKSRIRFAEQLIMY